MNNKNIEIIAETSDALVVNKPAGLLSQPDRSGDKDISAILKSELNLEFLAPVHRLDRNTSGCLILAKSSAAASFLAKAIKEGKVRRIYHAIVKGAPSEQGEINAPLEKNERQNRSFVSAKGKEAVTHFVRLKKWGATSLVEVRLATGRSHQIRAHFAHIGCPLIGDKKYAAKPWSDIYTRPALHAFSVEFPCSSAGEVKKVSCAVPDDFRRLMERLRGGAGSPHN